LLQLPFGLPPSTWVLAELGEGHEALNRLRESEQVLERSAEQGVTFQDGWGYQSLGRASLKLGRFDDARRFGSRALECSSNCPGFAAYAWSLLGDIAAHRDLFDAETAEDCYRNARALAEPRGMRPLVAQCHLGLGKLYRAKNDGGLAQEHLTTATAMYREMN